ncbi:MAG TPA: ETC complex I subunit [Hyphomicrobiales bacterium]|nr:ETC complex I subunit [Hyphomicrobiales bacterium]
MTARIYKPGRNQMQSGQANTRRWVLDYEPEDREIEPLMGWTASADMKQQVRLRFDTREEAIAFAEREGITYRLIEPKLPERRHIAYSDNFKWGRVGQWTH